MEYRGYTGIRRRRGRPPLENKELFDRGTPELQHKRVELGVKSFKSPYTETFVGILRLKRFLCKIDHEACVFFMQLGWRSRKTLNSPTWIRTNWQKMVDLYGAEICSSKISPYKQMSLDELEELEQERLVQYQEIVSDLLRQKQGIGPLTMDVVQYDKRPSSLVNLLTDRSCANGRADLQRLKAGIQVIQTYSHSSLK